ncbi:phosphate acyltransferase PlsX [Candidatus Bipolaricaulota bacterium]|nr:phosphate acyltransferase PlsX [Candidatus Bipolaricaulota bacterium]
MRILLDVMGGDLPPCELVRGGIAAGHQSGVDILFAGDPEVVRAALNAHNEVEGGCFTILPTTQTIGMDESPVRAVRSKRDSSLVRGLIALKARDVDAFVSPGNTGAVVAGSIFTLGRIAGIPRPGIAASVPTVLGEEILVIDVGANVDCAPAHLVHFALMGASYARDVLRISHPRIGLLNIGTEKAKGNKLNYRAFELLEAGPLPFAGNVEGHHLLTERPVDVVVCDGFVGNVFLKALEGGVSAVSDLLKGSIRDSFRAKIGGLLLRPIFSVLRDRLSYQRFGGAPLLGVNGVVVIAHGRSDAKAIESAIEVARCAVEADLNTEIGRGISGWSTDGG